VTLDEQFPDAPMGCEKYGCFVKLFAEPKPCFWCGTPTQWAEINYEGPLCSLRCDSEITADILRRARGQRGCGEPQ